MKRAFSVSLVLLLLAALVAACGSTPEPAAPEAPTTAPEPTAAPTEAAPAEPAAEDLGLPDELAGKSWDDIVAEAQGQTVNFYHWGGSDLWNAFYAGYLAEEAKALGLTVSEVMAWTPPPSTGGRGRRR